MSTTAPDSPQARYQALLKRVIACNWRRLIPKGSPVDVNIVVAKS